MCLFFCRRSCPLIIFSAKNNSRGGAGYLATHARSQSAAATMKDFVIVLSSSQDQVFYPGSVISGTVICENSVPKKFKTISVNIEGRIWVKWAGTREIHGLDACCNQQSFHELCLSQNVVIWNKHVHGQGGMFPDGLQNLPFSIQLPQSVTLPPSYNGRHGSVKYCLEARILREGKVIGSAASHAVSIPLTVANLVYIDLDPQAMLPVQEEIEKTLCCLWCVSAPVTMRVVLPRKSYLCQNDPIPVEVHVENGSFRRIERITVYVEKQTIFSTNGVTGSPRRLLFEPIGTVSSQPVRSHSSTVFKPKPIVLPHDTPPTLSNCKAFITINYVLHVSAVFLVHGDLQAEIPLVIGNARVQQPVLTRMESYPSYPASNMALPPPPDYESVSHTLPRPAPTPTAPDVSNVMINCHVPSAPEM